MEKNANFRLLYILLPDVHVFMDLGLTFKFQNGVNPAKYVSESNKMFIFYFLFIFETFILYTLFYHGKLERSVLNWDQVHLIVTASSSELMEAEQVCSLLSHKMAFFIECNERNSLTALLVRL